MEDLISCDDDVLSEVYQDWTPNVRRPPTLLLIRLLHELRDYMGKNFYFFYFMKSRYYCRTSLC